MENKIPAGLSNKHIHVTQEHLEILFGEGHELTPKKYLGQPGQYASEEKVDLVGPKRTIKGVRILGPTRCNTQVELSLSDGIFAGLGVVPVKLSGDLEGTPGIKIVGPCGEVEIKEGVIVAARHIHMTPADAAEYGVKNNDKVKVPVEGIRALTFENVLIRVSEHAALELHVDMEEGNACSLKNGQLLGLVKY